MRDTLRLAAKSLLTGGLLTLVLSLTACPRGAERHAVALTGGNVKQGEALLYSYGCVMCHVIPGVRGENGLVGPPLTDIASRAYLVGQLPNTPENMIRWIRYPQQISPYSAMPSMGVTEAEARDMAAYLYTLRR